MTRSHHAPESTAHYVHLKASVPRLAVVDGVLQPHALVKVDVASAAQPVGFAVVVHWPEQIRHCTLGDAGVPHDAETVTIRVSRRAPLAEVDVYGFPNFGAFVQWLYSALGVGNPPKTAGDGMNAPPTVT